MDNQVKNKTLSGGGVQLSTVRIFLQCGNGVGTCRIKTVQFAV